MSVRLLCCEVLLYKEDKYTNREEETWSECCVDLLELSAVRKCVDDDKERNGLAVIHFKHGDYFIINKPYEEVLNKLVEALK
jgi:hypothetical protein